MILGAIEQHVCKKVVSTPVLIVHLNSLSDTDRGKPRREAIILQFNDDGPGWWRQFLILQRQRLSIP